MVAHLPVSPWRSPALDPAWIRRRLARELGGQRRDRPRVATVEILYARARPAQTTLVYRAALRTPGNGTVDQLYSGHVVAPRRFTRRLAELRAAVRVEPAFGRALIPLRSAGLVLLAYPNDARLAPPTRSAAG